MNNNMFWSEDCFPVVYEHSKPKAVMVDMESFQKIRLILDNLMNRDPETEDSILAASGLLEKLVRETENTLPCGHWERELDELSYCHTDRFF
ncbi:MAG: hypothetical protein R2941_23260 [Desulfobacterales bacterium]